MAEIVGEAPLLLGLILANVNNNNNDPGNSNDPYRTKSEADHKDEFPQNPPRPQIGAVILHEQVAEILSPRARSAEEFYATSLGVPEALQELDQAAKKKQSITCPGVTDLPRRSVAFRLRAESPPPQIAALTQAQCTSYHTNGFLVVPNALTRAQADELLDQAHVMMKRVSEGGEDIVKHNVSGQSASKLSPVGRVLATFEPNDQAPDPFTRRIARLGCGVHQLPSFGLLTHSTLNRSIASALGYNDPRVTQSQLIAKLAYAGGRIIPHQDGCVSFTDPPSCLTFWYALEDCTIDNGCLEVAAGTHLTEPLRKRLIRNDEGEPRYVDLAMPIWAKGVKDKVERGKHDHSYTPLSVSKGTLVLSHGNLLHRSGLNTSSKNRVAYTFSIIEGRAEPPRDGYMHPQGEGEEYQKL